MAYLVEHDADDREILDFEFEGGERIEIDLEGDGRTFPSGCILRGMTLGSCMLHSMWAPEQFKAAVPERIVVKPKTDGYVPDFASALPIGGYLVPQGFVDLVEQLEPRTHQFFPIEETVDTSGRVLNKRFSIMNVLSRIDAVIDELSDVHYVRGKSEREVLAIKIGLGREPRLVLRKSAIRGHHVWRGIEAKLSTHRFFSEKLHDELVGGGFSPLRYRKCEEQ